MSSLDTRRQILQAAGPIFAQRGYQQATVREICRAAGVNLASVNYHFGDKERLYIEAVKHAQRLREQQAPLPAWGDDTPAEEKLRMFVLTMLQRIVGPSRGSWQMRLIMREIMEPTRACEEMVRESFRPYFQLLGKILAELLPAGTPQHRVYHHAFSVIGQCVYYRVGAKVVSLLVSDPLRSRHFGLEELADHITRVTMAAAQAESAGPPGPLSEKTPLLGENAMMSP